MYGFLILKYCNTAQKVSYSFLNLKNGDKLQCNECDYDRLHSLIVKDEKFLIVNVAKKTDL